MKMESKVRISKNTAQTASTTTSDGQTMTSSSARSVGRASRPTTHQFQQLLPLLLRRVCSWPPDPVLLHDFSHESLSRSFVSAVERVVDRHYSGPEMPPSLRIRQKWTAIRNAATNGRKMTCSV